MANEMKGLVGFEEDIKPLFTLEYRECMKRFLDLYDWRSVRSNRNIILSRLRGGENQPAMPPGGWPSEKIQLFADFVSEGAPKRRGASYAAFFRDLDSYTEYHDVYGRPTTENYMPYISRYFGKALTLWTEYAQIRSVEVDEKRAAWAKVEEEIGQPDVSEGILAVEGLMISLLRTHFSQPNGQLDVEAALDAFAAFGGDRLPEDPDRLQRIKDLGKPDDRLLYAKFHRMDGSLMWFKWMGHIECADYLTKKSGDNQLSREGHIARTVIMSAVCLGSAMDFVYRKREKTKDRYYDQALGEKRMLDQAYLNVKDWDGAVREAHELLQAYSLNRGGGVPLFVNSGRFFADRTPT